jgi:hypothetical protein
MSATDPLTSERRRFSVRIPEWLRPIFVIVLWLIAGTAFVSVAIGRIDRTLAFVLFAAGSAPVIIWLMWREDFDGIASDWHYRRSLKSREPLSAALLYERFYQIGGTDRDIVYRLLTLHAKFWAVDGALIRPEDNYCRIGGCEDEFVGEIEREFGVKVADEDWATIDGTFDSFVRYLRDRAKPPSAVQSM